MTGSICSNPRNFLVAGLNGHSMLFKGLLAKLSGAGARAAPTPPAGIDCLSAQIATNCYGAYCVPNGSAHRPVARRLLSGGVYEPDTIEYLRGHAGAGDIVHAGTYFGDFLPGIARALHPDARLWAFEPGPENYECARITALLNRMDNIELTHAALADLPGTAELKVTDAAGAPMGGRSHLDNASTQGRDPHADAVQVPVTTVDTTVPAERSVSVIQLDVEGHEIPALKGALETIRRNRPILLLEIYAGSNPAEDTWFDETILTLGYERREDVHKNAVYWPAA